MAVKKIKSSSKMFTSDLAQLEKIIMKTVGRITDIVGSSLGPGGRCTIIESSLDGIPNKNTKDGVTIFRALGSADPYEHLLIEQIRDVAVRVVNEAGDGPQPLNSHVLTPNGFVKMGELKVGDKVCGTNRTVQEVLGVYPKGQKEICRVILSDGNEVECCPDHLWEVSTDGLKKEVLTTKNIIDRLDTHLYFVPTENSLNKQIRIATIIRTGKLTEMQCIKVSNPDHLYVTDHYVVTHNTTTATIIAGELIKNLFMFCKANPKFSPQKVARTISKRVYGDLCKEIEKASIKITAKNKDLLESVATISTNGDRDMAKAVIEAFDKVGYGAASHVTIQELSGNPGYKADLIEGFPIAKGYEESIGKFHPMFINDQMHQRCILDNPQFLLFDGKIIDFVQIAEILKRIGETYVEQLDSNYKNVVIVAHGFSENVLTELAYNFQNPGTINVLPLTTPMDGLINSQLQFLMDVSAFTGAKIFDMTHPTADAQPCDLGANMTKIEVYRFRSTIVGEPDPVNIETRVNEIKGQAEQAASQYEKQILEERLGKISNGIAQLKIYGASIGELKEKVDRAEDAVCAVRAAITHGCVPGGCRVLLNLVLTLDLADPINEQILVPSLLSPFFKLLSNAGYTTEEQGEILTKLYADKTMVYDVENAVYGDCKKLGLLDATLAVSQALRNAASIASVMGTLGGIICYPRDNELEKQDARDEISFNRTLENADHIKNEADERF